MPDNRRAVKTVIRKLIDQEPVVKPISDKKICDELSLQGYKVARRTVAKYREQLNIPVGRLRKKL